MADDRLNLEARFKDLASGGIKKLGKTLEAVRPSNGMQAAQKWMGDFRSAADKANVAVRPLATGLSAVGIGGLAASLSMGELVRQFKDLADSTLTMRELGRQSRMSATEIARLQYAAGKLHVDPAAVGGAISSWSGKMVEFRRHTGRFYTELLRQNSDVARKIAADSPVDGLKDTLDFLSRIKDPQIQKRWADEAGVGDLVPMLGKGHQGLAEAFADAAREVKPISSELQAAADRFNDATNRFNQSWSNLKNDIGPAVIDPMSKMIDRLDEVLKFAAAHPGDAAAVAGVGALSAAGLYARRRIMRGSQIAGGVGAGGELAGAAREQVKAGGSLLEAAIALKEAAAELRGRGALPGGAATPGDDPKKPGGGSFDKGRGLLAILGLAGAALNAPGMDEAGDRQRDANASALESFGETLKKWTGQSWLEGKVDEWRKGSGITDGNVLQHGYDLKKDVQEGSKAGIMAGLRELAQQQELDPKHDGVGGVGAPSLRYGRDPASGAFRRGGRSGGGKGYSDTPEGQGHAGAVKGGMAMRAMAAMKYLVEKKGWTAEGAAIAVGNAMQESSVDAGTRPGDHGISHSMFQWNHERWAAYQKFSAERGKSTTDNENALDFFDEERKHRSGLESQWHKQTDLHNAGRMGYLFEGYRDQSEGTRVQNARDMLDLWKKQHPGATPPQAHAAGGWIRGAGTGTSDSIPAWLSHGEFVVRAGAAKHWGALLHAINGGHLAGYADGGAVDAGAARRRSWLSFFQRAPGAGGMGASRSVALGATAMMQGESGRGLNPNLYGWDVNGPSGGTAQWHDVTKGKFAGRLHRLSDLMRFAMLQHADWKDVGVQQAFWRKEASGPLAGAWSAMRRTGSAVETLRRGINLFENPADHAGEFRRRLPNIVRLARESADGAGGGRVAHEIDPIQVDIRHHPHTGKPIVSARGGRGTKIGIRSGPTMQPT